MTPEPSPQMRCRYIKSSGEPCRGLAIRGQLYCFTHGRDLRRYAGTGISPAVIHVPRLDNPSDIQQLVTDVARAVASATIDHAAARLLFTAARLASRLLPPPQAPRASGRDEEKSQPEAIEEVFPGPNGEDLAPEAPYYGPQGKPERKWSFAEYLCHKIYPGSEDKPLPEEGYINSSSLLDTPPAGSASGEEDPPALILDNLQAAAEPTRYAGTTPVNVSIKIGSAGHPQKFSPFKSIWRMRRRIVGSNTLTSLRKGKDAQQPCQQQGTGDHSARDPEPPGDQGRRPPGVRGGGWQDRPASGARGLRPLCSFYVGALPAFASREQVVEWVRDLREDEDGAPE